MSETKEVSRQKSLLTYICSEEGHNFGVVGEGYYKRTNGEADETRVYRVALCPKCGETKEICVVDRNKTEKVARKSTRSRRK